jgi:hypothetical protein
MEIISHGEQKKSCDSLSQEDNKKKTQKKSTHTEKSTRVQPRKKVIDTH